MLISYTENHFPVEYVPPSKFITFNLHTPASLMDGFALRLHTRQVRADRIR
jgi:hypothetical protein